MLQIKYARITEFNKMFKHIKINTPKNVFFLIFRNIYSQKLIINIYSKS